MSASGSKKLNFNFRNFNFSYFIVAMKIGISIFTEVRHG